MTRTAFALALATAVAMPLAHAADDLDLTVYRSDDAALYSSADHGPLDAGYALVHEKRTVQLSGGPQTVNIDGLPKQLDTEALSLQFQGDGIEVMAQRLLLSGNAGVIGAHVGDNVTVFGPNREVLAQGTLLDAGDALTVSNGISGVIVVRDYAAIGLESANVRGGMRMQVAVDAEQNGRVPAQLSYATGGIGWRAAYTGILQPGAKCALQFSSDASIANRSGRDWTDAKLKLVAGEPNFAKSSGPRPEMMKSMAVSAMDATYAAPEQAGLGDYRSYTLQDPVDLPNDSITQIPLYPSRDVACERTWLYEIGGAWSPPRPRVDRSFHPGNHQLSSRLQFTAFDSLPAGYLRVLTPVDGNNEFLGEARIADTPEGQPVEVELGTPFDLRGTSERTEFELDDAGNTLREAFRINLSNAGEEARTVTVRVHPNRWRNWALVSSSIEPSKRSTDTLEFLVEVPADGEATLEYALRYSWTDKDER